MNQTEIIKEINSFTARQLGQFDNACEKCTVAKAGNGEGELAFEVTQTASAFDKAPKKNRTAIIAGVTTHELLSSADRLAQMFKAQK